MGLSRKQEHILSLNSPRYDFIMVLLRLLSLLNALFCIRLPDSGVSTASVQFGLGILMFSAGYFFDPYFPPAPGAWDQNRLQNASDASVIAIYFAALLATIACKYYNAETLNSLWIVFSPLLVLPAAFVGYHSRSFGRNHAESFGHEGDALEPLMQHE